MHDSVVGVNRRVARNGFVNHRFRYRGTVGEAGEIRITGGDGWPQEEVDKGIGLLDVGRIAQKVRDCRVRPGRLPWVLHNRYRPRFLPLWRGRGRGNCLRKCQPQGKCRHSPACRCIQASSIFWCPGESRSKDRRHASNRPAGSRRDRVLDIAMQSRTRFQDYPEYRRHSWKTAFPPRTPSDVIPPRHCAGR